MKNLKVIRFNLQFHVGNETVTARTLTDLNNCTNINDLYEYFLSGQLERWLKMLGENEKSAKISDLQKEGDIPTVLHSIFEILDSDFSKDEISEAIASFVYSTEMQKKKLELLSSLTEIKRAIQSDFEEYNNRLKMIINSAEDFESVKAQVRELLALYPEQFKLDYMRFYSIMSEKCPLAIFTVLMEKEWRKYFLSTDEDAIKTFYGELASEFTEFSENTFADAMNEETEAFLNITKYTGNLHVRINGRDMSDSYLIKNGIIKEADYEKSNGNYYDPYPKGTKIMILHCGNNVEVRAYGDRGQEMKGEDAKFKILDGLEFRTNGTGTGTESSLFFMEV